MKVNLSRHHTAAKCCWCEKDRECVSVTFSDGFIKNEPMCWKCLQTAFKVRSRQDQEPANTDSENKTGGGK
jgi:hypothetical protein